CGHDRIAARRSGRRRGEVRLVVLFVSECQEEHGMVERAGEAQARDDLEPIPQPPGKPVIGNLLDLESGATVQALAQRGSEYRPISKMEGRGREAVSPFGFWVADELCDPQRFDKMVGRGRQEVRAFPGDGLFTADTDDPNWRKAHSILMPAF